MDRSKMLEALQNEIDAAFLYHRIADKEPNPTVSSYYRQLAGIEEVHVQKLYAKIREQNYLSELPPASWRARALYRLSGIFGQGIMQSKMMAEEQSITAAIIDQKRKKGEPIGAADARHVNILRSLGTLSGESLSKIEGRHRNIGGNALRAAVLGANDGLVSNFSLVMGVAGASQGGREVLIAGLAGLLAGAISMALGEWISVKSSQELYERQMRLEMEEIENSPEEELHELALLYKAKGISEEQALQMAGEVMQNPAQAHKVLVKEELGINADELEGSAFVAAFASFALFAVGAVIPVLPFFFWSGMTAIYVSALGSTVGLFLIGAVITLFTGRSILFSGLRQVIFGLLAAAVTFGIGKIIGVSVN